MLDPTSSCINNIVNSPNENMTIKKRLGVQIKEEGTVDKDQWRLCIVDNESNNGVIKYHNSGNVVEPQNRDKAVEENVLCRSDS